jgi:hypothetical protein
MIRTLAPLLLCAACSSGLRYTIDDQLVAGVSAPERSGVADAQKELDGARKEQQKVNADLAQANGLVQQCDHDCDVAEKDAVHAVDNQKKAEQGGDMEQVNSANKNKEVTAAGQRAADAKREFMQRKQRALQVSVRAADKHILAAQSRYELEKAKLVSQKALANVDVNQFDAQYQEFQIDWQQTKNEADLRWTEANEAERDWKEADKRWQEMRGGH